jgi:hypothetical protein
MRAIDVLRSMYQDTIHGSARRTALRLAINTLDGSLGEDWLQEAIERAYAEAKR